jgi:hypothetical protein
VAAVAVAPVLWYSAALCGAMVLPQADLAWTGVGGGGERNEVSDISKILSIACGSPTCCYSRFFPLLSS